MTDSLLSAESARMVVEEILEKLKTAWNMGDAAAFAAQFTQDADYTVWNGLYSKGHQAIVDGHVQIFSTFYKDSHLTGDLLWVRPLSEAVMLAQMSGQITLSNGKPGGYATKPLAVLQRQNGKWLITAWQNTPVVPEDNGSA